jgi:DNA (cytosine-5)-methyltransferase 1
MNGQLDIFSIGCEPFKIDKPIRLIELFGGIGAQAKALERLGAEFEHYRLCELDQYAVTSYNAIHNTNFVPSDITKLKGADLGICDTDKYTYILTYSYPCQSLSLAGKQEGMIEGSGTQSSLLWEVKRLLEETAELPQILVMENVPQVLSDKNKAEFYRWVNFLESKGYTSKWEILNAKDYGVPQNRERCFMVSWLGNYYYHFPQSKPLDKVLRDLLQDESEIDDKYYLSEKGIKFVEKRDGKYTQILNKDAEYCPAAITAVGNANWTGNFIKCEHIAQLDGVHEMANRVYSPNGLCPTIRTMQGGNLEPKIMTDKIKLIDYYNAKEVDSELCGTITSSCSHNGSIQREEIEVFCGKTGEKQDTKVANTITTNTNFTGCGVTLIKKPKSPIRKLTQKECWRLMDFTDNDYENARKALNDTYYKGKDKSGSQLYKQAGNSIVVAVLEAIFKEML